MSKFVKTLVAIFIFMFTTSACLAYDNSKQMLLDYYKATEEGDVETILEIIDVNYYNETTPETFTYKEYLEEMFKTFEISEQKVSNISIMEEYDFDLIFHSVEATISEKNSDKSKNSYQNMVAIVWNNGEDWKLGWIMTEEWYDHRLETQLVGDMVMDMTINHFEQEDIKKSFEEYEDYRPKDIDLEKNDFAKGVISPESIAQAEKEWEAEEGISGSSSSVSVGVSSNVDGTTNPPTGDDWEEKWEEFEKSDTFKDMEKHSENKEEWMKEQGMTQEQIDDYNERLKRNGLDGSQDTSSGINYKIIIFVILCILGIMIIANTLKKKKE